MGVEATQLSNTDLQLCKPAMNVQLTVDELQLAAVMEDFKWPTFSSEETTILSNNSYRHQCQDVKNTPDVSTEHKSLH